MAFSPDGKFWLSVGANRTVRWWSVQSLTAVVPSIDIDANIVTAAFSRDGRFIMVATAATVRILQTSDGQSFGEPIDPQGNILTAAFSPAADGLTLATGSSDGTAQCWDIQTGRPRSAAMHHDAAVSALAFSPDGQILLTASDRTAMFWDIAKGEAIGKPLLHGARINSIAFRADGLAAFTGSDDQTAQLWNVVNCQPIGKPLPHAGAVRQVACSTDGLTILTRCDDGTVFLWDAASGKPLCQLTQPRGGLFAALSPDSSGAFTVGTDGSVQMWKVPQPLPDNPALIKTWVEAHAGVVASELGTVEPISAEAIQAAREQLKTLPGATN